MRIVHRIEPIEEPYDDYEKQILEQIEQCRQDFYNRIEPLNRALAHSRSLKPVAYRAFIEQWAGETRVLSPDVIAAIKGMDDDEKPKNGN